MVSSGTVAVLLGGVFVEAKVGLFKLLDRGGKVRCSSAVPLRSADKSSLLCGTGLKLE